MSEDLDEGLRERASTALESFRGSLEADGYELHVAGGADILNITIREGSAACPDCLVPQAVMSSMFTSALQGAGIDTEFTLAYPGDADDGDV